MSKRQVFNNRRERFLVMAENRTNKVLKALRVLGHCNNQFLYEYKPAEIDKILVVIEKELSELKLKFKTRKGVKFSLNENL